MTYNNTAETLAAAVSAARIALTAAGCEPRVYILDNGESSEAAIPVDAAIAAFPRSATSGSERVTTG